MDFQPFHKSLAVLHCGTEPPASYFIPYGSEETAAADLRDSSDRFLNLCGQWDFRWYDSFAHVDPELCARGLAEVPHDRISVPMCWQNLTDRDYDRPQYIDQEYPFHFDPPNVADENPCGLYARTFYLPEGERFYLNFEGVSSCFYVWVNGRFMGYSQVSHATSVFDVTEAVTGGENLLTVLVCKWCDGTYLEDQDFFRLSGIFREVYLLSRPADHIRDYYVRRQIAPDLSAADISVEIEKTGDFPVAWKLYAPDGAEVARGETEPIALRIGQPVLWNDEAPETYRLVMTANGEVIQEKLALRRIEIVNGVVLINGEKVKLKGVNRHDSHPTLGYATPMEHMKRDLALILQANCNAIRTSHYPNDPRFARLCEDAGIMLVDEADLECHGAGFEWRGDSAKGAWSFERWAEAMSDNPDWEAAYVDRAKLLFERDKNRGCVVMWSLGNESSIGRNHRAMRQYIKGRCPDALVHYENAYIEFNHKPRNEPFDDISDVESRMYAGKDYIQRYFTEHLSDKPFFLCEYVDSMTTGDVFMNWELVEKYDGFFGAHIWEFCDHTVDIGGHRYTYGGYYDPAPDNGVSCVDGLVHADRKPRPGYYDMKKVYQPWRCTYENGSVTVTSKRRFRSLADLDIVWQLECEGRVCGSGRFQADILPGESKTFPLFDRGLPFGHAYLTLRFVRRSATAYVPAGFQVGFAQFRPATAPLAPISRPGTPVMLEDETSIRVITADNICTYDKAYGRLCSIVSGGRELLASPVNLCIWHPKHISDRDPLFISRLRFNTAYQKTFGVTTDFTEDGGVSITADIGFGAVSAPTLLRGRATWSFAPGGAADFRFEGAWRERVEWLPKIGIEFRMPEGFEQVRYYGRGPIESYPERRASAPVGQYDTTVTDMFEHYIYPQECGSHMDTLWAYISEESGSGLYMAPWGEGSALCFKALHYDNRQLQATDYDFNLKPEKEAVVSLDYRYSALAADGRRIAEEPELRLTDHNLAFGFRLKPLRAGTFDPFRENR